MKHRTNSKQSEKEFVALEHLFHLRTSYWSVLFPIFYYFLVKNKMIQVLRQLHRNMYMFSYFFSSVVCMHVRIENKVQYLMSLAMRKYFVCRCEN